ncbi:HAD family hydrolase [Falsiroseomonas stagni]|uniref:Haloacid dehalogenase superfamily, subfamily IA, variant 3 with third motif having DD or ED n=1 Tax=Falsiroseomonas stagni DSM 19981 TaxID=1123062 RepID=A0A1I3ZZS5_9PROT|nr:HAD family phosphatase [Falsiroseomonas stagni]SFK49595.1 haloacid dehalogenase superfamily, subfamily IA, variant 3 with third motif having DD or ED [Falsiroseomonas stagni DSM 19981]
MTRPGPGLAKRPAAVLFDCDGVLADTEAMHNRIMAEEISALGWEMTAEQCERHFMGLSWEAIVPRVQQRLGPDSVPADFIQGVVRRVLHELHSEVVPVPGVLAALQTIIAAGIPVAVASNSSRPELNTKLAGLGLAETFRGRSFTYNDVPNPKPAPDMYRAAAAACGVDPHDCVVVEDSVTGARAGRAAGCRVLGFAHPTPAAALQAVGAETFTRMAELPGLLGLEPAG